ncbi:MAG: hypothetical protein Q8O55_04030 [Dehalococcoidales bacterium]|nr:hypothetical protein [Dehalococcoidales bacterium]
MPDRRLFFDLLHAGRALKEFSPIARYLFLSGMKHLYKLRREDIIAGENIGEYWKEQNSGAEE